MAVLEVLISKGDKDNMVYTVKDLESILQIGKNTAYALMKADGFPSYKINNRYFVTSDSLEMWLKSIKGKEFFVERC